MLGTLKGGEVLVVAVDDEKNRPYVVFHALDLERSPAGVRSSRVALPPGKGAWKLGLSPRGDRLVWLLGSPPGDHGIQRWSLWTSRVRGERMHCLGEHPDGQPDPERSGATLDLSTLSLRWLPDGRRISFVAGSGLYVLPAE